uniref:Glycosyltransferase n=1 Tax=Rhabditophanes sp. KR3021 TaxID=114890 RepID=A0AC35U9L1_9BILA
MSEKPNLNGFKIYDKNYFYSSNVLNTSTKFGADRITKVVTCSSSYIKANCKATVANWNAPMILGVIVEDNKILGNQSACVYCTIKNLGKITSKLALYFIFNGRVANATTNGDLLKYLSSLKCHNKKEYTNYCSLKKMAFSDKVTKVSKYPINPLRNVMKKEVKTNFVIFTDMDHLYSKNFERKMSYLAKKQLKPGSKKVLVFRMFEVHDSIVGGVNNKTHLARLLKSKKAYEFHAIGYPKGHKVPKLKEWLKRKEATVPVVQFVQPYKIIEWEPQIVSRTDIPDFYAIPYPLHSNTSHRRELCRAGYAFLVASDCFAYHRGFKSKNELRLVRAVAKLQIKTNKFNKTSLDFEAKLDKLYPNTHNKCPRYKAPKA